MFLSSFPTDKPILILSLSPFAFAHRSIRNATQKENLGIIVQYKVKVKIVVAMGG